MQRSSGEIGEDINHNLVLSDTVVLSMHTALIGLCSLLANVIALLYTPQNMLHFKQRI